MPNASNLAYWSVQLPSLLLAVLVYLLLGRLLLSFVLDSDNPLMRLLAAITNPVVATVGAVTPRLVPPAGVLVFAIAWLAAARLAVLWVGMVRGVRL